MNIYWSMGSMILIGAMPLIGAIAKIIFSFTLPLLFGWLALFVYMGFMITYYVPL